MSYKEAEELSDYYSENGLEATIEVYGWQGIYEAVQILEVQLY